MVCKNLVHPALDEGVRVYDPQRSCEIGGDGLVVGWVGLGGWWLVKTKGVQWTIEEDKGGGGACNV